MRYVFMTYAYGTRDEIIAELKSAYNPTRSERRQGELIRALIEIEDEGAMSAACGDHKIYFVEESESTNG